ncbi:MAG: M20 family metallo-hydrolase [Cyclobacteriaceae bacterium]|nr:M20 family metallo-hydrolase [Cyclobacteriaceae bacterium]
MSLEETIKLLQQLIRVPSLSREEKNCADFLSDYFDRKRIALQRIHNNLLLKNRHFDPQKENILLNSHLDTVRANENWTVDPFDPVIREGKISGLGSNDAGASLVSLLNVFMHFYDLQDLNYNLIFLASAEEEISGIQGVTSVLPHLEPISFGIVGEPTGMHLAIAEKGLMVLDCKVRGISGHAARNEGNNAIYMAIKDIEWIREHKFPDRSELLGDVKMTVTKINAGTQHNVIPDECSFVVDVRSTDVYPNEQILEIIKQNLSGDVIARSTRLQSSSIHVDHILVKAALSLGISLFGSDTLSDQALMPFPTAKIGPGDSSRSHTADEFILADEIRDGIGIYIKLLDKLLKEDQKKVIPKIR